MIARLIVWAPIATCLARLRASRASHTILAGGN